MRAMVCLLYLAFAATRADAHHHARCEEISTVVGFERCARFAARWGLPSWVPSLSLDVGLQMHRFSADPIDARSTVTHAGMPYSYRLTTVPELDSTVVADALALRMTATIRGRYYAGAEEELGALARAPRVAAEPLATSGVQPAMSTSAGLYMGARGLVGVQGGVDRVTLAGELDVGIRMIVFDTRSRMGADLQTDSILQTQSVLEGRVRASYWLSPWITVGASFGTSLVQRGDVAIGVDVAAHSRTFSGRR